MDELLKESENQIYFKLGQILYRAFDPNFEGFEKDEDGDFFEINDPYWCALPRAYGPPTLTIDGKIELTDEEYKLIESLDFPDFWEKSRVA